MIVDLWVVRQKSLITNCEQSFGGLMVSMLASGTRVRGFEAGRNRWIFQVSE